MVPSEALAYGLAGEWIAQVSSLLMCGVNVFMLDVGRSHQACSDAIDDSVYNCVGYCPRHSGKDS
jgi:hypothetical protein